MIIFDKVTKTYGSFSPVSGFSAEINEGETIILSGASGSGKSTLLALTAALIRPTSGDVIVDGRHIAKLPENFASLYRRDNIGIIFQNYNLLPALTVIENVCVPLLPEKIKYKDLHKKAMNILERLDMADKADMQVTKLSGGEQQRTAIARALINDPKIILADEPTANLDHKLTNDLAGIFIELATGGRTMIIASHDKDLAAAMQNARVISL